MKYTLESTSNWIRNKDILHGVKALRNWTSCSLVEAKELIESAAFRSTIFETSAPFTPEHERALAAAELAVHVIPEPVNYVETALLDLVKRTLEDKHLTTAERLLHVINELKHEKLI